MSKPAETRQQYELILVAKFGDGGRYSRKIPYNWHPSKTEAVDAVRRLSSQFVDSKPTKITALLRKIEVVDADYYTLTLKQDKVL